MRPERQGRWKQGGNADRTPKAVVRLHHATTVWSDD